MVKRRAATKAFAAKDEKCAKKKQNFHHGGTEARRKQAWPQKNAEAWREA
jgi:hypothetical protein